MNAVSRRLLLKSLGLSAALSATGKGRPAWAAEVPRRVVFFYTKQGVLRPEWDPTGGETDFQLGRLHGALAPHKSRLILMNGIDFTSAKLFGTSGNAHEAGEQHSLAPWRPTGTQAGGISIDQEIANGLKAKGVRTVFPSLVLKVADKDKASPSFSAAGNSVPGEEDPRRVLSGLGGSQDADPDAEARLRRDKSMLDFVAGEIALLRGRFGKADRDKLEAHLSAIRDLENQITTISAAPRGSCPTVPADALSGTSWKARTNAMSLAIRAAFACDATRVATYVIDLPTDAEWGYSKGMMGTPTSHELCHQTSDAEGGADKVALVRKAHLMYNDAFARLLDLLAETPQADGKTLLDHTAVLWCGQIANGGHARTGHRWIIAGSGGDHFRTGRYLKYQGVSHADVFVSLGQMMGLPMDRFGGPGASTGPLSGLR